MKMYGYIGESLGEVMWYPAKDETGTLTFRTLNGYEDIAPDFEAELINLKAFGKPACGHEEHTPNGNGEFTCNLCGLTLVILGLVSK